MAQLTLINGPDTISYSRNPVNIKLQTVNTDSLVLLKIFDDFNDKVVTIQGRPDVNRYIEFDISEILNSLVKFDKPDLSSTYYFVDDLISPYYCIADEVDADDLSLIDTLNIGWDGSNASLYVIKGGVDYQSHYSDIFQFLSVNKKYLTWLDKYYVPFNKQAYIYYLHQTSDTSVKYGAYITYDDGTITYHEIESSVAIFKYDVLAINAGFNANSLQNVNPALTPLYHDIYVFDQSGNVLAKIRIKAIEETYYNAVQFFYANSLGGNNTTVLEGNGTVENKINADHALLSSGNVNKETLINATLNKTGNIATGYKTKNEIDSLTDMPLNDAVYQNVNGVLRKVVTEVTPGYEIKPGLIGVAVKYHRAIHNLNYSPDEYFN